MWWRLRGLGIRRAFCHAEDVWRTTRKCVPLADHQFLNHADVSALVSAGQTLVMTEKDAVKCRAFAEENWWYLPVDAQLSGDEPAKLLAQLTSLASGN